jgi:hypothetical protein
MATAALRFSLTFEQDGAKLTGAVQGPQGDPIDDFHHIGVAWPVATPLWPDGLCGAPTGAALRSDIAEQFGTRPFGIEYAGRVDRGSPCYAVRYGLMMERK